MAELKRRLVSVVAAALVLPGLLGCTGHLSGEEVGEARNDNTPSTPTTPAAAERPTLPGYSVLGRLNRIEYDNTVRDLLGTSMRPSENFPADDLGAEFDTVGSALSLSPLYVVAYERAAHALTTELFESTNPERDAILFCDSAVDETCARRIVQQFARRAFRRPVSHEEVNRLLGPVRVARESGASPTDGLRHALTAVLMSPHFLFKVEAETSPDSGAARPLTPHEVATRLSYALWSTTPDDELLDRADAGELLTEHSIASQIDRMLADERSDAFLEQFFASWLHYRDLETHEVEATAFPDYDEELAASMKVEATEFFREFLNSSRPVSEMMNAPFTFVDARLAEHYGLSRDDATNPDQFTLVDTSTSTRRGMLTLGALLVATSLPSRTSPVKRGHFVFQGVLCEEVPPPPPGVEGLAVDTTGLTLRERLELHRASPACQGCHAVMDQLGFGLENYDAIGQYRTMDGSSPVNASGLLPDGSSFDGALDMAEMLADDDRFTKCLTRKLVTFTTGRLVDGRDGWTPYLAERVAETDGSLRNVIRTVLLSDVFRTRQAGEAP